MVVWFITNPPVTGGKALTAHRFVVAILLLGLSGSLVIPVTGAATNQVIAWGNNYYSATNFILPGFSNVVQIAGGSGFNVGLKDDGSVILRSGSGYPPLPVGLSN